MEQTDSAPPARRPVIGVFGHYGNENLGDEAIIEALIERIRLAQPDVEIRCFSVRPLDSARRYGVAAYPIRRTGEDATPPGESSSDERTSESRSFVPPAAASYWRSRLKAVLPSPARKLLSAIRQTPAKLLDLKDEAAFLMRSYRRLRGMDALIIAGSNQFLDNFGGPWGFPYTLLKWSVLSRIAGCRLLYVSVGAGPLHARLSHLMVRLAIRHAHYLSFRDAASRSLVLGQRNEDQRPVYPDLAHGLHLPAGRDPCLAPCRRSGHKPVIGINPMPLYDRRYWCETDEGRYEAYVEKLAAFTCLLLKQGYPVFFFPTQPKDVNVTRDILSRMRSSSGQPLPESEWLRQPTTTQALMSVIQEADIIVATRFHGTLLSLHARRPVVAICYYRKTRDLMREMGQEDCAIDFDSLEVARLMETLTRLEGRRQESLDQIHRADDKYIEALERQFASIFPIIGLRAPQTESTAFGRRSAIASRTDQVPEP